MFGLHKPLEGADLTHNRHFALIYLGKIRPLRRFCSLCPYLPRLTTELFVLRFSPRLSLVSVLDDYVELSRVVASTRFPEAETFFFFSFKSHIFASVCAV